MNAPKSPSAIPLKKPPRPGQPGQERPPQSPPQTPSKSPLNQPTQVGLKNPLRDSAKTSRFELSPKKGSPLHCFFQVGDKWQHKQFSSKLSAVRIGPSSFENEIGLNDQEIDKVQVIAKRIENKWYVMECGKDDLMRANGIPTRQVILKDQEICVLQVGESIVILCLKNKPDDPPIPKRGVPAPTEMCLSFTTEEQYPLSPEFCLIGANPFCNLHTGSEGFLNNIALEEDIKIFETPFVALIFKYKERLFFCGFDKNIRVNEIETKEPVILPQESQISFNKTILNLRLPSSVSQAPDITLPSLPETTFSLVPAEDPEERFPELHIPASTRSLTIGRSSQKSDIAINDTNISRQHAQFIVYPKNMMIYDCGSSNGTFVNDEKITKKTIRPGDKISFGDIIYYFCYAEE